MTPRESILDVKARMACSIVGQEQIIERLLIGPLTNGNLLVEGLPGPASRASSSRPTCCPLSYEARADGVGTDEVPKKLVTQVAIA